MTPLCWVVGAGGLLGGAWVRASSERGSEIFAPAERLAWHDAFRLDIQIGAAVDAFVARVGTARPWSVLWAAGIGSMGSDESAMQTETRALASLLGRLQASPILDRLPGKLLLASSAGAIYAASTETMISESTAIAPTTPYAQAKLEHERLVREHGARRPNVSVGIARFSTLYGPAHSTSKPQGLISHMARRIVRNQPLQIFVPYDTIRDYLHADDAARLSLRIFDVPRESGRTLMRIVASETPTTIAEIISVFRRVNRRPIRLVTSANRMSGLYVRRMVFRSSDSQAGWRWPMRSLSLGISEVLQAERAAYVRTP